MTLDIVIRLLAQGSEKVKGEIKSVAGAAGDVDKAIAKVGKNNGFEEAARDANSLDKNVSGAGLSTDALGGKLEGIRNKAAGLAVAGGAGLMLAENFIAAGLEADRLNAKMDALLSGAKMSGASKEIEGLAGQLAALTGGDDDTIAGEISQAIVTGRVRSLTQYGIAISKSGQEAITAAYKVSDLAGRQEALNQVMKAAGPAIAEQRKAIGESAYAIGEFNTRWGNMEEKIGQGAARAKAQILGGLLSPLMSVVESSEGLQTTAGAVLFIGSSAATAIGSVVAFGSQVALTLTAFPALGAKATAAFVTMKVAGVSSFAAIAAAAAPLLIALGLIITTAIAAYKAVQWTKEATTKSDEEMENGTMREKFVKRSADFLGESKVASWSPLGWITGNNPLHQRHLGEGDAAEQESTRILSASRSKARARQVRNPNGSITVQFEPVVIEDKFNKAVNGI